VEILENREEWLATYRQNWLAHYQKTGETDFKLYDRPTNTVAPSGPSVDLSQGRLLFITTAGAYLREEQEPYDAKNDLGDYTIRLFPSSTPFEALAYAHTHYDHGAIDQDPQVLMPLRHLEDLVAEGVIGELAANVISCMGYQPDVPRTLDELIPAIVEAVGKEEVDAALLVPA